ncbi:hypothetical protein EVAR_51545_1 [Eumeta japonica]|uniref:Uncharacterized protein n=1 Tax=Eumeta variegata TaxID=151549 RepID=A0A4C1YDA1_EUMVA|nr:hypothetical protein EVAR_51545_1 [Eumeta japonica]
MSYDDDDDDDDDDEMSFGLKSPTPVRSGSGSVSDLCQRFGACAVSAFSCASPFHRLGPVMCINTLAPLEFFFPRTSWEPSVGRAQTLKCCLRCSNCWYQFVDVSVAIEGCNDDNCRPIRKCPGVNVLKSDRSADIGVNGREFNIASIRANCVVNSSQGKVEFPTTLSR